MPNGFERQEVTPGSENPKEVKPMSEGVAFILAAKPFRELREEGFSEHDALDVVSEQYGVDRDRFFTWFKDLEEDRKSHKPTHRFHTPEQVRKYKESRPDLFD